MGSTSWASEIQIQILYFLIGSGDTLDSTHIQLFYCLTMVQLFQSWSDGLHVSHCFVNTIGHTKWAPLRWKNKQIEIHEVITRDHYHRLHSQSNGSGGWPQDPLDKGLNSEGYKIEREWCMSMEWHSKFVRKIWTLQYIEERWWRNKGDYQFTIHRLHPIWSLIKGNSLWDGKINGITIHCLHPIGPFSTCIRERLVTGENSADPRIPHCPRNRIPRWGFV